MRHSASEPPALTHTPSVSGSGLLMVPFPNLSTWIFWSNLIRSHVLFLSIPFLFPMPTLPETSSLSVDSFQDSQSFLCLPFLTTARKSLFCCGPHLLTEDVGQHHKPVQVSSWIPLLCQWPRMFQTDWSQVAHTNKKEFTPLSLRLTIPNVKFPERYALPPQVPQHQK